MNIPFNNLSAYYLYQKSNYKILTGGGGTYCYIFPTSHIINEKEINENYIKNFIDSYQWENTCKTKKLIKSAHKIIFIRDIYSRFYIHGINSDINSIDKLITFLKEETKGYPVIIAGYSSGAYLTTILSMYLTNVVRAIAFGPIFDLQSFIDKKSKYWEEILSYYSTIKDNNKRKFFNLISLMKKSIPSNYICFYGNKYELDVQQYHLLKTHFNDLPCVGVNSSTHCGVFNYYLNIKILTCSNKKFNKFINKFNNQSNVDEKELLRFFYSLFELIMIKMKKRLRNFMK